ncbi:MAG: hypothetical protein GEU73_07520 [Chloroflexi bacterium]|nr:hypothetical protein [Chloroflexota bacterium]
MVQEGDGRTRLLRVAMRYGVTAIVSTALAVAALTSTYTAASATHWWYLHELHSIHFDGWEHPQGDENWCAMFYEGNFSVDLDTAWIAVNDTLQWDNPYGDWHGAADGRIYFLPHWPDCRDLPWEEIEELEIYFIVNNSSWTCGGTIPGEVPELPHETPYNCVIWPDGTYITSHGDPWGGWHDDYTIADVFLSEDYFLWGEWYHHVAINHEFMHVVGFADPGAGPDDPPWSDECYDPSFGHNVPYYNWLNGCGDEILEWPSWDDFESAWYLANNWW